MAYDWQEKMARDLEHQTGTLALAKKQEKKCSVCDQRWHGSSACRPQADLVMLGEHGYETWRRTQTVAICIDDTPTVDEQLMTLLDMAQVVANRHMIDDEFLNLASIHDLHDIGHVLTGGDALRYPWQELYMQVLADEFDFERGTAAEDVLLRMKQILLNIRGEVRP